MTARSSSPVPVEPAATLILLRRSGRHTQVLMQVRHRDIAFAGGALVFPGGKLEAQDNDPRLDLFIDDVDGGGELKTQKVAAIRETFEECGLLLARAQGSETLVSGERLRRLALDRQRLNGGEQQFIEVLRRESLRLACDALVHFAHWITPGFMPRRFDTHFFLALTPGSQEDVHDGQESVESVWIRPEDALDASAQGRYRMLFPTRSILHRLAGESMPADRLRIAADTPVVTVSPRLVRRGSGSFVQIPADIGYGHVEEQIDGT